MYFGSLLKEVLKENKIPVTRFAEKIGLNRVAVYSVFNGEKAISQEVFDRIIKTYNFSPKQNTELFRAFRLLSFSREKLELMEFIRSEVKVIGKSPLCPSPEIEPLDLSKGSVFLSGRKAYYCAVAAFLKNESESKVIYTNYSFFDEQADKLVYDFICGENCRFSVRHTIVRGNGENIRERLRNGFASIKFAKRGHFTDVAEADEATFAFPTHFVGEKTTIMYDPKNENGFITTNESVVKAYCISAAKRDEKRPEFNRFIESSFELKNIMEPLMMSPHVIFESHMPVCYYTSRKILDETLRDDIENREVVLSSFWSHLSICRNIKAPTIFVQSAIKRFAENGQSLAAPEKLLKKISAENRKAILLEAKRQILSGESPALVADDGVLNIDENIEVYNFDRSTLVSYVADGPNGGFIGSGLFSVNDRSFLPLLNDFYDYLVVNDFLLSKKEIEKAFDEGIEICDKIIQNSKE